MRYLLWLLVLVCAACAAPGSQSAPATPTAAASQPSPESPFLPIYADDLVWGSPDPLVTIVAFLDFADQESRTQYAELMEQVAANPALRLVVKQAPLGPEGELIAEASLAVRDALGPQAAREFLAMVSEASGAPSKEDLSGWALGLTPSREPETVRNPEERRDTRQQLQRNLELARRLELSQNPVLYVNGARWQPGGDDDESFTRLLAEELRSSKASRPGSSSPELHYARRVEENWSTPEVSPSPPRWASLLLTDAPEPAWGSPSAPVTLVEFTDFECPFCARVVPTLTQLKQKYGPKQLRIVFKHNPLPFHKTARPAAEAAVVVYQKGGDKAFWRFHDRLFENQKALTSQNFERWAAEAGVPPVEFRSGLERDTASVKVSKDMALAAKVGAAGTPAFRINGVTVSGAQPFDK
ncbi:MAG TPA: thioredoxin domain-containing protein, partial [Polyangiaceae bacterium]|nr:thioredoxin domain-containing protein [Polyangiaceae bacterium]